jgi:protein SCO1/2
LIGRPAWFPALRLLAVLALAAGLAACGQKQSFRATDITGADFGKSFTLIDHNGATRTLGDFKGKVVVMFFGFTHCPDVCPTTLQAMKEAMKQLGADADRVQVLLVTVDPERDTPEVLKQYVTAFDPRFLGLTGDSESVARTTKEFKVIAQKNAGSDPNNYTIDHSAGTYLFDTQGRLRLFMGYGQGPDVLVHDVRALLAQG